MVEQLAIQTPVTLSVINLLGDFHLYLPQFLPCKIVITDYRSHRCCWRKAAKAEFTDVQLASDRWPVINSPARGLGAVAKLLQPVSP